MAVSVVPKSRLKFGSLGSPQGFPDYEIWDLLDLPTIPERDDDEFYQVAGAERIDQLAFRFYGDVALWWVIAVANGMELLPSELNEGDFIRIPSKSYVTQQLFKRRRIRV